MADLFDGYRVQEAYDEVFAEPGVPHEQSRALHAALQAMSATDLDGRSAALARAFRDQGITFLLSGKERPAAATTPTSRRSRASTPVAGRSRSASSSR